jgi:hypothetical protein
MERQSFSSTGRAMRSLFAAVLTLGSLAAGAQPSPFAPVETPSYDLDALKMPQAPPSTGAYKINPKPGEAKPALGIPNGLDLGKSRIEFNASRTRDVNAPGVNIDSGETSNLSKVMQGQKQDGAMPNYFGLKLSTPMH